MGLVGSCATFACLNFTHISELHPELARLDSVYVPARGFPLAQWAANDPKVSGHGQARSAVLWGGWLANATLFSALALPVCALAWSAGRAVAWWRRGRRRAASSANESAR